MEWLSWLEASGLGTWVRSSAWAYPFINVVHVAGLVLLVGSMMLLDLRLMGAGQGAISVFAASEILTPFAVAGLILALISGVLLFLPDATPLWRNPLFLPKIVLIALGVLNALAFRRLWRPAILRAGPWPLPTGARMQAAGSLLIWTAATVVGRLLAYV